jgi:hypothetical protein
MPARFKTLKALEETTTSTLKLVRDSHLKSDFVQRRFKTADTAEIEGLQRLFAQLATLESPQLDRIIEAGADEKGFFVLTPAPLEGVSLPEMLQRGPLSAQEFEILANQLLDALEVVHDQAIVHGTLTPECVRLIGAKPAEWQVCLGGFGIGFAAQGTEEEQQIAAYRCAAPEQWEKSPARRRTDIYALGCVLYETLAGRPAFQSRSLKELRVKHLGRDLPDLAKVALHVPRWMADWVMSLIITAAETRPRKASVARETFAMREAAPAAPPAAPVSPATPPISAPVMLPMSQLARNATASTIPISVGPQIGAPPAPRKPTAVLAAPKPAARQFLQQPAARPLWHQPLVWGSAAAVIAVALWAMMGGSKTAPKGAGGSSASLVDVPTTDPAQQAFRSIGTLRQRYAGPATTLAAVLPASLRKPWGYEKLLTWLRADLGVNTFESRDLDQPAKLGDAVALWHDFGPLGKDNAIAILPWDSAKQRARLQSLQPEAESRPLRTARPFIVFGKDAKPVSSMNSLGATSGEGVPFSDAAVTGVTLIVVFYHDSSLAESTGRVAQVNFGDGSMSLITDASGKANFNIGGSASAPPEQRMQTVLADSARLDTTVPTLAMASWSKDGRIIVRMINARGETASGTGNKHSPVKSLHNICLAGDGYWSFRDQGNNTVPFYGGIAELRLYNQAVSQSEMQALEKELAGYYFP